MHKKLVFSLIFLALWQLTSSFNCAYAGGAKAISDYRSKAIEHALDGETNIALDELSTAVNLANAEYGANSPFASGLYYDMGSIALNASLFPRAESYLRKAVEANPNSVYARIKLSELMTLMGRPNDSKTELARVLSKHADSTYARSQLIKTYEEEGNAAQATKESFVLANVISGKFKMAPKVVVVNASMPSATKSTETKPAVDQKNTEADKDKQAADKNAESSVKKTPVKTAAETAKQDKAKAAAQMKFVQEQLKKVLSKKNANQLTKTKTARAAKAKVTKSAKNKVQPVESPEITEVKEKTAEPEASDVSNAEESPVEKPSKTLKPLKAIKAKADSIKSPEGRRANRRGGLVPPPPPVVPVFQPMPMPQPRAEAPAPKPKKAKAESVKDEKPGHSASDEDPDFLLDWADAKKKK